MNPGLVLYALVAVAVFLVSVSGLWVGIRNGAIRFTGFDSEEEQSELKWTLWAVFANAVSQSALWPLSLPAALRGLARAIRTGQGPRFTMTLKKNPFTGLEASQVNLCLEQLHAWRKSLPSDAGGAVLATALMLAAISEGEMLFDEDISEKQVNARLVEQFRHTLSVYDGVRRAAEASEQDMP